VLACDIPAKGAVDDRQRATVADGAAYFCTIPADGGIDDGQGAAGAVVDASAVAEGAIPASDSIPGDDAVDDRQGAEAVVDAAAVFLSSTIADGHLGKPDLDFGFGANDDDLAVDASAINNRCLRTGTDNLQVEGDEETLVIGRGGDEDDITRQGEGNSIRDGFAGVLGRPAVVVVTAVHSIDIPFAAGHGGGHGGKQCQDRNAHQFSGFHFSSH